MSAASVFSSAREEQRAYSLAAERATGLTFLIADTLALLAAFAITIVIRGMVGGGTLWPQYLRLAPFLAVILLLIGLMDLYPGVLLNPVEEFRRLTIATMLGMSLAVVGTFLVKESNAYSRIVFVAAGPLGWRWTWRRAGWCGRCSVMQAGGEFRLYWSGLSTESNGSGVCSMRSRL
jgi:hypothetical protein